MRSKPKLAALLLTFFWISATLGGIHIPIAVAETPDHPPFLMAVHLRSFYSVRPDDSESWGHEVIFSVGDPDGVDNLFIDGEVSFSILSPDGVTHPLPGEHVDVSLIGPGLNALQILWFEWFPSFPVFGEYTITVWDADGLSVAYTTFPTRIEYVPTTVPTITYPPNFGTIYETVPTFTWETYIPEKGNVDCYGIGVLHEVWIWHSTSCILPDETSAVYNFDGSSPVTELPPGQYGLILNADISQGVVFEEDRYIESIDFKYQFGEYRGAEAHRSHMFTVAHPPQEEYKIEFEAEASGAFWILEGILGPETPVPFPIVAVGEGVLKLDGDATVDQVIDNVYLDFPAEMKTDGEIKGEINPAEFVDGDLVVYEETWRIELEFWNLDNAGGIFWPDDNVLGILYEPPPEGELGLCMGYKLELEGLDVEEDDEELKMSGEAYGMVAGLTQMDGIEERFIIILDVAGDPYTLIFSEDIGSDIEVEVELDID